MKKVLIFGAGLVTRPPIRYLLKQGFAVTVATRTVSKAEKTIDGHPNGSAVAFDVSSPDTATRLNALVQEHDLTISLLPYAYHVMVAKACISHKKPMVTTSYVSDAMKALHQEAKDAGVLILNEIGVDPGIDHMSAMQIIDAIKEKGGSVERFSSCCGGLPAPKANNNPFGYKFSWSPRGVVLAGKNSGKFIKDSKEVNIAGAELFKHHWPMNVDELGELEYYTNRNSVPYIELYKLQGIKTIFRGTIRNPGWCDTWAKIIDLEMADDTVWENSSNLTYADFMRRLIKKENTADIREAVAVELKIAKDAEELNKLEWLGLFSDEIIPLESISPIDVLVHRLLEKLEYKDGEPDMIVLQHEFTATYPDKKENITSTLVCYGEPDGDTSMAKTVGLPAAIATRMILEGKIKLHGVRIPVYPEIYNPVLEELENYDVKFVEKTEDVV